jgi:hypothetical protein
MALLHSTTGRYGYEVARLPDLACPRALCGHFSQHAAQFNYLYAQVLLLLPQHLWALLLCCS